MGAHFRLPILAAPERGTPSPRRSPELPVWLTDAHGAEPYDEVDWTTALRAGHRREATGFTADAWPEPAGRVMIPMAGPVESLNAAMAATVLMFEVARQRRRDAGEVGDVATHGQIVR